MPVSTPTSEPEEKTFEIPPPRLARLYARGGLVVMACIVLGALPVVLLRGVCSGWVLLAVLVPACLVSVVTLALRLRLEHKRLVLDAEGVKQYRRERVVRFLPWEDLLKVRAFTRRGAANALGLNSVEMLSRGGERITQLCEDATAILDEIARRTAPEGRPVEINPSTPRRTMIVVWTVVAASAVGLVGGLATGRKEVIDLWMGGYFLVLGVLGVFFRRFSARHGLRKVEVLFGILLLAAVLFSVWRATQLWTPDPVQRGLRCLDRRMWARAGAAFAEAEAEGLRDPRIAYGQGIVALQAEDYAAGERKLRAALRADPNLNEARYQLSRVCFCEGKKEEARELLEEYLARGGGRFSRPAREALRTRFR